MNKGNLVHFFRQIGLMHFLDKIKFAYHKTKYAAPNKQFLIDNPDIRIPPDYIMFESFYLHYGNYYNGGKDAMLWVKDNLERFVKLENLKILDWGCGPSRLARHLPEVVGNNCQFFGTDYNKKTIEWCSKNIEGVNFSVNELSPPTSYSANSFDVIYGISIFTHLSEEKHSVWLAELSRILKKRGTMMITTQGVAFKEKMTSSEQKEFDAGKLVVRGKAIEGHRVYSAFQPPVTMTNLFKSAGFEVLELLAGEKRTNDISQDTWFVRKV